MADSYDRGAPLYLAIQALGERLTWLGEQQAAGSAGDAENVAAVEQQTAAIVAALGEVRGATAALAPLLAAIRDAQVRPTTWNALADSGAVLVGTTVKPLRAAPGAGLRSTITALQMSNTNALAAARVEILDGANVIWAGIAPANATLGLAVSVVGGVNGALGIRLAAALTGGVLVAAQGIVQ